MFFIGDIHGNMKNYEELISQVPRSIQVGDFGHGFTKIPEYPKSHVHLRGNHDDPALAKVHPNFLGEYGIYKDYFYVSGAYSRDGSKRILGVSLFANEEISYLEFQKVFELSYEYQGIKKVVSHDAPEDVYGYTSLTSIALSKVFQILRPELWVYGHHHEYKETFIKGCRFICAPKESIIKL